MNKRVVLRIISLVMFVIAVVFVACALSNPTLGSTFYIFGIRIGVKVWHAFYLAYVICMIALFAVSFFIKKK